MTYKITHIQFDWYNNELTTYNGSEMRANIEKKHEKKLGSKLPSEELLQQYLEKKLPVNDELEYDNV